MKKIALFAVIILAAVYFLGPKPDSPAYDPQLPTIEFSGSELDEYVRFQESNHNLKPGNEARILWADPAQKNKTDVALVYLHGFTASHREGFPVHQRMAKKLGANLYLARLSDHGIDTTDALLNFTSDRLWESAKEAYAIGKKLGHEVIIMSTSTGGTLALRLAATYPEIKGLINYSPNIEINDPAAFLLNDPWGLQIARAVFNSDFRTIPSDAEYDKFWYSHYRLESIVHLQELVETTCKEDIYENISCPVFNGFYYLDEANQDPVVRVTAIKEMHGELATPDSLKKLVAFPSAGSHVIACDLRSGSVQEVIDSTYAFCRDQLKISGQKTPE